MSGKKRRAVVSQLFLLPVTQSWSCRTHTPITKRNPLHNCLLLHTWHCFPYATWRIYLYSLKVLLDDSVTYMITSNSWWGTHHILPSSLLKEYRRDHLPKHIIVQCGTRGPVSTETGLCSSQRVCLCTVLIHGKKRSFGLKHINK